MSRTWLLLAILASRTVAFADELALPPAAKRHYDAGNKAYTAQDFAVAAKEFEAAYAEAPDPRLLYAWAQAEKYAGRCDKAIELYKKYLQADLTPKQADDAHKKIAFCEHQLPVPAPPPPSPPPPPPPPPAPDQPAPAPHWYADPLGDGLAIASAAGLVIGVVYIARSSSTAGAATNAVDLAAYRSQLDDANSQRHLGLASLGIGVALAGASAFVLVRHHREHAGPIVGSDGRSIFIGARF